MVYLMGEVDWEYQKAAAESCVHGLFGVKGVFNHIHLKEKNILPEVIKQKIEEVLKKKRSKKLNESVLKYEGIKLFYLVKLILLLRFKISKLRR